MKNYLYWVFALSSDLIIQLFTYFFLLPASFFLGLRSHKRTEKPLLFIHGYCHFNLVWWFYFWRLKKHFGPIYTLNLGSPLKSIPQFAKKVERILPKEKNWTLIGHSMGGLISTYLAVHSECKDRIEKIITLGSPFQGTKIAHLGWGKCLRQMEPNSSFLQKLEEDRKKLLIPIYYLATKQDQIAIPYETALPEKNPQRERVLEGVGHIGLLVSEEALQQVEAWIKE